MTFIVPVVLGGLALSVMALVSIVAARKGKHPSPVHHAPVELDAPRILVHAINEDRCVGCDACVAVCPTNVLDLVNNKSKVLRFQDCIQCEACMWVCPTDALVMHPEGTEPPKLKVPDIDENFQTPVPGQYLIGEVAGKPLVKNAANLGRAVVEHMLREGLQPSQPGPDGTVDVAIVGSGPGGLSAALTCIRHGLSYVVLEKEQMVASTVSRYPKGKLFMAEPYDVRNLSFLPVFDSSKEEIVPIWEQVVAKSSMNVKMGEPVEEVKRRQDGIFEIRTTVGNYTARRVVLAIGTRGKPRTLGVPGENLPKVQSLLEDPADFRGQAVLVVGGGDSAVEAAMALADAGARVVLSYRGKNFGRAQKKNQTAVESYAAQKKVKVLYQSNVTQFTEDTVTLKMGDGQQKSYPNQAAFVLIGADPPVRWLAKVGVEVVERPHSFSLGKSDEVVVRWAGEQNVVDCPDDAELAVVLAREGRLPEAAQQMMPQVEDMDVENKTIVHFGGARKLLRTATSYFTSAFRIDQPMPLSEFAKRKSRRIHTGHGRRDSLSAAERTRVLRMLRDEGGRLADEDTRMLKVDEVAPPAPPMFQQPQPPPPQPPPQPPPPQQQQWQQPPQQQWQPQPPPQQWQQPPQQQQQQWQPPLPQQPQPPAQAKPPARTLYAHGAPAAASKPPPKPSKTLFAHGAPAAASQGGPGQPQAPAQAQRPGASLQRSRPAFDDEPTRQVDGDSALAMLLDESKGSGGKPGGEALDDAAATQAVPRYGDPLAGSHDEPTRIGQLGQGMGIGEEPEEPTRAVDMNSWLQSGGGGNGGRGQSPSSSAPTRAMDLSQLAREQGLRPDEMPTRAVNVSPRTYPHGKPDRGPHGKPE